MRLLLRKKTSTVTHAYLHHHGKHLYEDRGINSLLEDEVDGAPLVVDDEQLIIGIEVVKHAINDHGDVLANVDARELEGE